MRCSPWHPLRFALAHHLPWALVCVFCAPLLPIGCSDTPHTAPDADVVLDVPEADSCPHDSCNDDGLCRADGAPCTPAVAQPSPFVCVDDDTQSGTCRRFCQAELGATCPPGYMCDEPTPNAGGFCQPSQCQSFFGDGCADGQKCVPVGNQAALCFISGVGMLGEACTAHTQCAPDLVCVGGVCLAPDCSALSSLAPCPTGSTCRGFILGDGPLDIGQCAVVCAPFANETPCLSEQMCEPLHRDTITGALSGFCVPARHGLAMAGEPCGSASEDAALTCTDDTICVRLSTGAECYTYCDPEAATDAPGSCSSGERCRRVVFSDGTQPDWGICDVTCAPWKTPSGCLTGDSCVPDLVEAGLGYCVPTSTGLATQGSPCDGTDQATTCADGLMCVAERCRQLCDPDAPAGASGDCGGAHGCVPLVSYGNGAAVSLAVGMCMPACTYDASDPLRPLVACPEAGICQPGFTYGVDFDVCIEGYAPILGGAPLSELDTCPDAAEGEFCRPGGMCLRVPGLTDGTQCMELCARSFGCGVDQHPNCGRAAAVCECRFGDAVAFGVCGNE